MALTTVGSATQTCGTPPSTEHVLDTETTAGTYVALFNLVNAANGDSFRIRVYNKTLTGDGGTDTIFDVVYAHDQGVANNITTPPWVSMFETKVTIQQVTGTARNVPWALILVTT